MGYHFLLQCVKVKSESEVTQLCPTLSDPMDCGLPGFSIHGIFQAGVLEWGAIAVSISEYNCPVLVSTMGLIITSIQRSLTPGERRQEHPESAEKAGEGALGPGWEGQPALRGLGDLHEACSQACLPICQSICLPAFQSITYQYFPI